MPTLSQVLIGITQKAERLEVGKKLGQLVRGALRNRRNMDEMLSGIEARMAFHEEETSSWLLPEQVRAGESGPFDTLDLGVWLEIAEKAGVAAVPAIPILTLTEDEASLASGSLNLSGERSQRLLGKIAKLLPTPQQPTAAHDEANVDAVLDKLFDAMDKVPEGWMVRHARSGGSNLKALAGAGVAGSTAPEVRFNANLEVGPGWVRVGNRRRVDVTDMRTIKVIAEGPSRPSTFYARPWVQASRWRIGDDPHRHGTVFAGKGRWPCEWRVYVKKGKVIGVANYYGWLGDATPLDARMALMAKAKA